MPSSSWQAEEREKVPISRYNVRQAAREMTVGTDLSPRGGDRTVPCPGQLTFQGGLWRPSQNSSPPPGTLGSGSRRIFWEIEGGWEPWQNKVNIQPGSTPPSQEGRWGDRRNQEKNFQEFNKDFSATTYPHSQRMPSPQGETPRNWGRPQSLSSSQTAHFRRDWGQTGRRSLLRNQKPQRLG